MKYTASRTGWQTEWKERTEKRRMNSERKTSEI